MKTTKLFASVFMAMAVAFSACTNVNDPENEGSSEQLPFTETFETGIGTFTTQSVSGDQVWAFDAIGKYMKVSGYISATQTNVANEDWLISPEIDLKDVTAAKLTFDYVTRYFANLSTEATVWVSENYVDGLPATASWTQLTTPAFKNASSWDLVPSGEISLTAYAGKKIKVAFKYVSTDAKAGTWEVKNFKVEVGEAEVIETVDPVGEGAEAAPYNVAAAIQNQSGLKWVSGYIVGYVWSGTQTSYVFSADSCTQATNILIADTKTETNPDNCMAVQLPSGAIRAGLNLVDVKANLGKSVKLYGSLEAYFAKPGIKSVSYYELEGGSSGGNKPADTSDAILTESFLANQGAFTIVDVTLPEGGTYVWKWDSYKFMKASAYIANANKASEGWLISPTMNLTGKTSVNLSFEHTGKYFTANKLTEQVVLVSSNYSDGAPSTASWTTLTIPAWPTGNDWNFVNSGNISLSAVEGQSNVRIAFKYSSTTAGAATWEIRNVLVK
ncbi:MAG: choice-of-anchor J domain-containing protein [Paludibacteraceae bacterium]|nr:choice-of-anchor J domain-containing protein [Paludibacteraceae bacterium]